MALFDVSDLGGTSKSSGDRSGDKSSRDASNEKRDASLILSQAVHVLAQSPGEGKPEDKKASAPEQKSAVADNSKAKDEPDLSDLEAAKAKTRKGPAVDDLADELNAVKKDIQERLPGGGRPPARESEGKILASTEKPLRSKEEIRAENKKINERVSELEKSLQKDRFDPDKRDAAVKELQGIMRRLDILMYNLPDKATDADIQAAKDAEVKRYAKHYGISTDLPIDELYMRVNKEWYVRQLRGQFENDCKKYGLDPEKSTFGDLRFRQDCEKYKLDPKTTSKEEAKKARAADYLQYWAKYYGLPNPDKATQADVDKARAKNVFDMDCISERLDPRTTKPEDLKALREKREKESRESWCKTYGLDPKTTTKEKFEEVHNFKIDCHLYKLDPKTATREQLAQKILETECAKYGLDPKKATMKDIEQKKAEDEHKRLCLRYGLDARATTTADLHEYRCETFGVPITTSKEQLLDLEDRWDSRRY